jgi:hypothetical protein
MWNRLVSAFCCEAVPELRATPSLFGNTADVPADGTVGVGTLQAPASLVIFQSNIKISTM